MEWCRFLLSTETKIVQKRIAFHVQFLERKRMFQNEVMIAQIYFFESKADIIY